MAWRKLGRIFAPSGELDWSRSHAALPVPEWIEGDIFRIYFSGRDGQNRSSIGSVIVDLAVGGKILDIPAEPILRPGARGMFDDCGVSIGSIVRVRRYATFVLHGLESRCHRALEKHHRRGD